MVKKTFKDYTDSRIKTCIQRLLYRRARYHYGIISSALIVAGPDIMRHIKDIRDTVAITTKSTVTIIDIDPKVTTKQEETLSNEVNNGFNPLWLAFNKDWQEEFKCYDHNVIIKNNDIANEVTRRFIDADLMGTINKTGNTLLETFKDQYRRHGSKKDLVKCFLFTVSVRDSNSKKNDAIAKVERWLISSVLPIVGTTAVHKDKQECIKMNVDKSVSRINGKNKNLIWINKRNSIVIKEKGRLLGMDLFSYNDHGGPMLTGIIAYK